MNIHKQIWARSDTVEGLLHWSNEPEGTMAYNTGRALGQLLPPISAILWQFCFNDIFLPGVCLVSVVSWQ